MIQTPTSSSEIDLDDARLRDKAGDVTLAWDIKELFGDTGTGVAIDWRDRELRDSLSIVAINWTDGILKDDSTLFQMWQAEGTATGGQEIVSFATMDAQGFITNGALLNETNTWTGPNDFTAGLTVNNTNVALLGAANKEINITFSDPANPFFNKTAAITPTWTDVSSFYFSGTNEWGVPDDAVFLVSGADGDPALNFRIFDVDNALMIAQVTNFTGTATTGLVSTIMQNLPASAAHFIFQIQRAAGGANDANLFSIKLRRKKK